MGNTATSLAIVNADGQVVTFVRLDVPDGWSPPDGCTAIPDDELPPGWQHAPDATPVPASISARQIRLWLVRAGFSLDMIAQVIASIPDQATRDTVAIEWEYAPVVERSHPWLAPLGQALGLDDANIDQAFREAATL